MGNEMLVRAAALVVCKPGTDIFSDYATRVEIQDEGAGEFVAVSQNDGERREIRIDTDEWPALREAIERLVKECRESTTP